jgi:hypothetical protein
MGRVPLVARNGMRSEEPDILQDARKWSSGENTTFVLLMMSSTREEKVCPKSLLASSR